jgi:hypothetical protein
MTEVACELVRWVNDEPQPGLVEAQLVDSAGRLWSFIDKAPIFSAEAIAAWSTFPIAAAIRCEVIGQDTADDGSEVVVVTTERPDGVDSDGVTEFRVPARLVR